ncbi:MULTISPECIES: amidase [unclassified Arthrobacter]|uniref:amidase n=1 Tax=unclassified Arthrobacter TaxID=235627 RepID=UPI0028830214|nr:MULTISPECIES: amidase [unclassified Arthrobacter]
MDIATKLRTGKTTPGAAVADSLSRVAQTEREIRAWVTLDPEGAAHRANELQALEAPRGPLWGIPVAVKDLIDVEGLATGCGSPLKGLVRAERDADCISRLKDAGAIVIGKTVTTEFGYFKPGPTRNPVNPEHTPGGSSSGSAAAVASGAVGLALGTQTAGSLTRPASYCGVTGFVTAHKQFSMAGVAGLSHSLDTLGLLTRTVGDMSFAWHALSGLEIPNSSTGPEPLRLLIWKGSDLGDLSSGMTNALEATVRSLRGQPNISLTEWTNHSLIQQLAEDHATVMAVEAASARQEELGRPEAISKPLLELLLSGRNTSRHAYLDALDRIASARETVSGLMLGFDAILGPAALGAAPVGLHATGSPILSRPWQALGLPVLTIPGIRDHSGMPLGLQLIGMPGKESQLFGIGQRLESTLPPSSLQ